MNENGRRREKNILNWYKIRKFRVAKRKKKPVANVDNRHLHPQNVYSGCFVGAVFIFQRCECGELLFWWNRWR